MPRHVSLATHWVQTALSRRIDQTCDKNLRPECEKPLVGLPRARETGTVWVFAPTQNPPIRRLGGQASGCCCFFGDHFGHSSVAPKSPALAGSEVASSSGRLDSPPGSMCREADHGISNMSAGAASLAGRIRVGCWADRYASSGRCIAR